jgi:Tol biopolymer transport system component
LGPDDDHPSFSPDSTWVLYIHDHAAYRIPSLGGEPHKLLDNIDEAVWSPDGRQLAFVRLVVAGPKIASEVGTAAVGDGTAHVVRRFENRYLTAPTWSPDARTIALTERRSAADNVGTPIRTVILLSPDGANIHELECPLPGGAISNVTWSGDSQSIMYEVPESSTETGGVITSPVGSAGRVLLQKVRTGKARTLFAVQSPVGRLQVAAPGRIIFDSLLQRSSLREIPIDSTPAAAPRWLARGSSIDRQPYYSPDGDWVVFSSSRSGDVDLWEVSTTANTLRRLTDNPASDWDPFFTSDGKNLLWSSNRGGVFEIWMADRDGSSPRQVSHDGGDAENPVATPGGWVFYTSAQSAHPGLWKVRADGSEATLLVPGKVSWPDISPDGQFVLYHTLRVLSGRNDLTNSNAYLAPILRP